MKHTVTSSTRGDVCTVRPRGEIDISNAHVVERCLEAAVASAGVVVVDLSRVTFMDCAALSVLLSAARSAARRGRHLVLTAPRPPVQVLFDVFDVHPVLEAASVLARHTVRPGQVPGGGTRPAVPQGVSSPTPTLTPVGSRGVPAG